MSQNIYIYTQAVSRLVDITAGGDILGLCDQKGSHKHVSDFGRLWNYGHFLNSYTRPYMNRVLWSQLAGDVLNLVDYHLHCKHYLPPDSPTQLRQCSFCISKLGRYLKNAGQLGGCVFAWPGYTA